MFRNVPASSPCLATGSACCDFVIIDQCLDAERKQFDAYDSIYCIICGRKSSNGDQAQSGRYTELQDASNKRKEMGTLEIS